MAGSINLSLSQRLDKDSLLPLSGGLLYFFAAGTSDPQNAYQDEGLTIPWPNPLMLDGGGNIPQLFFADGQIKIRLTNKLGVVQQAVDNILVIGPSSGGGGGGGGVDATTVLQTGDIKTRYGTGNLTGFVRLNGRTIGSATSGASELANSTTQPLFEYLWNADANLVLIPAGRGVSANADWVANKQLTLPDARGRVLASLDDMGNSAAGRLTSTYFGSDATVLGAANGGESQTLTIAQLPASPPTGTITTGAITNTVSGGTIGGSSNPGFTAGGSGSFIVVNPSTIVVSSSQATSTFTGANLGSGSAHPIVQPTLLVTNYIKI